jgi:hypothetical protein
MKPIFEKLLIASSFAVVASASIPASASYVCSAAYLPPVPDVLGEHGALQVSFTTAPSCGGKFEGSRFFCSQGASSPLCAAWHQYPVEGLMGLFAGLLEALHEQSWVSYTTPECIEGTSYCGGSVTFHAW